MKKKFDPEQLESSMLLFLSVLGLYSAETESIIKRIDMTSLNRQVARIPVAPIDSYATIQSLLRTQPDYFLVLEQMGLPFGDRDFTKKQFHCALKLCLLKYEDANLIWVEESSDGLDWIVHFPDTLVSGPRVFHEETGNFVQAFYQENQILRMMEERVKCYSLYPKN